MIAVPDFVQQPPVQALAWALLYFLWQGAALGLACFFVLRGLTDASADAFFASVTAMSSSFEAVRVLRAVVARPNLSERMLTGVLKAAITVGGDIERANLLVAIAHRYTLTGQARELYVTAARAIRSEIAENRALAALVR